MTRLNNDESNLQFTYENAEERNKHVTDMCLNKGYLCIKLYGKEKLFAHFKKIS